MSLEAGVVGLVLVTLGLQYGAAYMARTTSWWAGGLWGLGIGWVYAWLLDFGWAEGAVLAMSLGMLGLVLDYWLSKNYAMRKKRKLPNDWWSSGGGFYGSGSGGWGFGGGMGGGSGAKGKW